MTAKLDNSVVVQISDCTASQLVGENTFKIASGTLTLENLADHSLGAKLILKIDGSSFALPIEDDAIVGTRGDRAYLFTKKLTVPKTPLSPPAGDSDLKEVSLGDETTPESSSDKDTTLYVQIDMPSTASEAELTKFEKCLVEHGFLMVGVQAEADNLSRTFLEWTGLKSRDLSSYTLRNTNSGPATREETKFSTTTHEISSGAASGTTKFAEAATRVGDTINSGMASIGSFIGSKVGTKGLFSGSTEDEGQLKQQTKEAINDGVDSVAIMASSVGQSAQHVGSVISDTTTTAVEHNYGKDAAKIKDEAATVLGNTASVGATAFEQSSAVMHGAQVGKGAVAEEKDAL